MRARCSQRARARRSAARVPVKSASLMNGLP
jgi:hypothetical protein